VERLGSAGLPSRSATDDDEDSSHSDGRKLETIVFPTWQASGNDRAPVGPASRATVCGLRTAQHIPARPLPRRVRSRASAPALAGLALSRSGAARGDPALSRSGATGSALSRSERPRAVAPVPPRRGARCAFTFGHGARARRTGTARGGPRFHPGPVTPRFHDRARSVVTSRCQARARRAVLGVLKRSGAARGAPALLRPGVAFRAPSRGGPPAFTSARCPCAFTLRRDSLHLR
jgi:hypothetical protein